MSPLKAHGGKGMILDTRQAQNSFLASAKDLPWSPPLSVSSQNMRVSRREARTAQPLLCTVPNRLQLGTLCHSAGPWTQVYSNNPRDYKELKQVTGQTTGSPQPSPKLEREENTENRNSQELKPAPA